MKIIVKDIAADAADVAADLLLRQIQTKPDSVLGLATGSTPLAVYARLREDRREGKCSFAGITTFNLDEYLGLPKDDPRSYAFYMRDNLFSHVDIDLARTHLPDGLAPNPDVEANRYESMIADRGGIDLMLLGLGRNAHIGFNEPGSPHDSRTRAVDLSTSTMEANAVHFSPGTTQPSRAITMGIGTILQSRSIVVLATGAEKAAAVAACLQGPPSVAVPGSALFAHADTTFVLDKAAAQALDSQQMQGHDA